MDNSWASLGKIMLEDVKGVLLYFFTNFSQRPGSFCTAIYRPLAFLNFVTEVNQQRDMLADQLPFIVLDTPVIRSREEVHPRSNWGIEMRSGVVINQT